MTDLTDDQVRALLDGATPGPWRADGEPWNRIVWSSADNRVCFMAHSSGLNDARDIATSNLVAAAPDLARALISTRAEHAASLIRINAEAVEAVAQARADAQAATALAEAEAEIVRLKNPRAAARLICDEVLQKSSDEAAAMREAMVKATMGTKVPALTGEVRWSVVNDALRALAALSRPHATKGDEG